MELEGDERQGVTGGLGIEEGKGHVEPAVLLRIGDELSASETLTDHFGESGTRTPGQFLPHKEVIGVESVDHLPTDHEACTLDEELTDGVHPMGPWSANTGARVNVIEREVDVLLGSGGSGGTAHAFGGGPVVARVTWIAAWELILSDTANTGGGIDGCDSGKINDHVLEIKQIPGSVEGHLHITAESNVGAEWLLDGLHRKVGVLVVSVTPVGDCGVLSQIPIGRPESNELGEGTTSGGPDACGSHTGHDLCRIRLLLASVVERADLWDDLPIQSHIVSFVKSFHEIVDIGEETHHHGRKYDQTITQKSCAHIIYYAFENDWMSSGWKGPPVNREKVRYGFYPATRRAVGCIDPDCSKRKRTPRSRWMDSRSSYPGITDAPIAG